MHLCVNGVCRCVCVCVGGGGVHVCVCVCLCMCVEGCEWKVMKTVTPSPELAEHQSTRTPGWCLQQAPLTGNHL